MKYTSLTAFLIIGTVGLAYADQRKLTDCKEYRKLLMQPQLIVIAESNTDGKFLPGELPFAKLVFRDASALPVTIPKIQSSDGFALSVRARHWDSDMKQFLWESPDSTYVDLNRLYSGCTFETETLGPNEIREILVSKEIQNPWQESADRYPLGLIGQGSKKQIAVSGGGRSSSVEVDVDKAEVAGIQCVASELREESREVKEYCQIAIILKVGTTYYLMAGLQRHAAGHLDSLTDSIRRGGDFNIVLNQLVRVASWPNESSPPKFLESDFKKAILPIDLEIENRGERTRLAQLWRDSEILRVQARIAKNK